MASILSRPQCVKHYRVHCKSKSCKERCLFYWYLRIHSTSSVWRGLNCLHENWLEHYKLLDNNIRALYKHRCLTCILKWGKYWRAMKSREFCKHGCLRYILKWGKYWCAIVTTPHDPMKFLILTSRLGNTVRIIGLCEGTPAVSDEFPSQMTINAALWSLSTVRVNKFLNKQSSYRSDTSWPSCDVTNTIFAIVISLSPTVLVSSSIMMPSFRRFSR